VTEDIFFSESGKIIQDKIFELCLRISERENLPQKFIGSSLGYSYPYPSTSVPKLNDAARFNQNRPRVWQPFVMAVLIEQGEVLPLLIAGNLPQRDFSRKDLYIATLMIS